MPDGAALWRRRWAPAAALRGTVVLVHGLGEHGGRYGHVAAALTAAGWAVVAVDHRGHGRSPGARGRLPRAGALWDDLSVVLEAARAERPGPMALLGHSMGGLVAARWVAAHPQGVDALLLSSPALATRMTPLDRALLWLGRRAFPDLAIGNGLPPRYLSRDLAVVAAYLSDPLVHDRVSPRLVADLVDGGHTVRAAVPTWRVPTLLWWAGADRYVDPAGSAAFAAAAPAGLVTPRAFPAAYHELLNEPEREAWIAELVGWLDATLG
jgi:alpha-beta hydrolase superfamily lysophospholipase